jgi:hypothetical protein
MMTLFSVPKPFGGHIAIIQRNAIESWTRLKFDCEIVLCGNETGTAEIAKEFRLKFLPDIACNQYGTPLLDSVFEQVQRTARNSLLCYVNADIILLGSFMSAVQSIGFREFLMIGQRWDLDVSEPIRYETAEWEDGLKKLVERRGSLHPPTGIDYFVFPQRVKWSLPAFAVGRPGWDNWFIYRARKLGVPVVDATNAATVIHQNHDYAHIRQATGNASEGPEAEENRRLIGGWQYYFTIRDATHRLAADRSISPGDGLRLMRNFATLPVSALKARKKLGYVGGAGVRALKRWLG